MPTGNWPRRDIQVNFGQMNKPVVGFCDWFEFNCVESPWLWGNSTEWKSNEDDDYEDPELAAEENVFCGMQSTSTTSSSTMTTTTEAPSPTASPKEVGNQMDDKLNCYNSGEKTIHERLDNTIRGFCNELRDIHRVRTLFGKRDGDRDIVLGEDDALDRKYEVGDQYIEVNFQVKPDCEWKYNYDECHRYLEVPASSCNCGGVNGKQGGTLENNCYSWRIDPNHMFR